MPRGGQQQQGQPQLYEDQQSKVSTIVSQIYSKTLSSSTKTPTLIQFYSQQSNDKSARFKDKFVKLAGVLKPQGISLGAVDCDTEQKLCQAKSIKEFPSYMLVVNKEEKLFVHKDAETAVTPALLTQFIHDSLPTAVYNIRQPGQLEEFVKVNASKAAYGVGALLVTSKYDSPLIVKSLAFAMKGKVAVGEIRGKNDKLTKELNLDESKLPVLLFFCSGLPHSSYETYAVDDAADLKDLKKITTQLEKYKSKEYCKTLSGKLRKEGAKKHATARETLKRVTYDELKKMPVSRLKELLADLKLSETDLLEKEDFVRAIMQAKASIYGSGGSREL